jgi:predicted MPP superfamily phosphohydrolase
MKRAIPNRMNRRRLLRWVFGLAPVMAAADAFVLEPEWVRVRRIPLHKGIPRRRFVQFSDLHHKGDRGQLQSIIDKINRLSPEFVSFTGDIVEDAAFLPEALELMQQIKSPLYGIPGNHDYWSQIDFGTVATSFAATGGAWLMDEERILFDGTLNLIGATCTKPPMFKARAGMKNVLMIHYPHWVDQVAGLTFDLMLAGHSHGGQVRLPLPRGNFGAGRGRSI